MNALYDTGRNAFLLGNAAWLTNDVRAQLVDTALYTVDLALHDFYNDIPVGARVGSPISLLSKTGVAGVADAADTTFPNVSGATVEALVLYEWTGVESTSQLIAYIDTATGLPVTPGGGDIVILWDNGTNKIFKL